MAESKILYVEDEEVLASLVIDHLERNGYLVKWVASGNEAEMVFKEFQPDLCILDIMLPGLSGYEIGKLIENRSEGKLKFALPSVYPALLRLENRGWIKGRWVEKPGERQRCFYKLTAKGRRVLAQKQENWNEYIAAVNNIMEPSSA